MNNKNNFCQEYAIQDATPEQLSLLNAIEMAAATIFPQGAIPEHILSDKMPLHILQAAMAAKMLWVALNAEGAPVGYALLQIIDGVALLAQLDVHPAHGQRGIGTALVHRVIKQVHDAGLPELYLTTFSHVRWNAPFYQKLGFNILAAEEHPPFIINILQKERSRGLHNRVAMQFLIQA